MQIYNLKDNLEYDEWADNKEKNRKCRIERK